MLLLKKILAKLLLPPLAPLLLLFFGLLIHGRRPKLAIKLIWIGFLATLALCTPACVGLIVKPLENQPALDLTQASQAQAIVILAGGRNSLAPEYGGETISRLTLERVRYGALLARQTGLPVLVSGGAPTGGTSEAALMVRTLEKEFGVPVRWRETNSMDTRDNARMSAAILQPLGIHKVILVSHAMHLRRAQGEFAAVGMETLAAPTGFFTHVGDDLPALDLLPSASAAYAAWFASHEWLGILAQKLRG